MVKNDKGFHEFEVVDQEFIPNKDNPEKVLVTVEAEIRDKETGNSSVEKKSFRFEPSQIRSGAWEKHVVKWIEEQEDSFEIPDLQGATIKNTGYDHTGPERDYSG